MYRPKHSTLELIVGCMFSGKTEELLRRIKRAEIAKQKTIIFKPAIDDRYMAEKACTHDGNSRESVLISEVWDIPKKALKVEAEVIGIDEVQFFNKDIIPVIESLVKQGKRVICSGLDMDFKEDVFYVTAILLAKADFVDKLTAVCVECGAPATKTQRRVEGKPIYEGERIQVGGKESYVATCSKCY